MKKYTVICTIEVEVEAEDMDMAFVEAYDAARLADEYEMEIIEEEDV